LALTDFLSRLRREESVATTGVTDAQPTKALERFLSKLPPHTQPVVLDLGPVVGPNLTFFGAEFGCKIFVEDLFKDVDRHAQEGKIDQLPAFLASRFPQQNGSLSGILCWDIFDYLDRPALRALAAQLTRILVPEGVMLAFFNQSEKAAEASNLKPEYTKYVIASRNGFQYRPYAAARGKRRPVPNRDIQRLFEPLRITEQFLLKTNLREVLFRKPPDRPASPS
jgi:hypothetical protein